MATITDAHDSFDYLFKKLNDKDFAKSLGFESWGERNLLPLVRAFLLGYFGEKVLPEQQATLPGTATGVGRLDFIIDDIAVEFAVRTPTCPSRSLLSLVNNTEVKKLLKFEGKSILILFDFSKSPLTSSELNCFRELPSLGCGNYNKYPFQVSYFYLNLNTPDCIKKQIRVR